MGHVKEAEMRAMMPQTKECQGLLVPPEARRGKEGRLVPRASEGSMALTIP